MFVTPRSLGGTVLQNDLPGYSGYLGTAQGLLRLLRLLR